MARSAPPPFLELLKPIAPMGAPLENPRDRAPWYNATGAKRYLLGMLASAFAVHPFLAIVS